MHSGNEVTKKTYILLILLKRLQEQGEVKRKDFAKEFNLSPTMMNAYLATLAKKGLIIKCTSRINGYLYLACDLNFKKVVESLQKRYFKSGGSELPFIDLTTKIRDVSRFSFENIKKTYERLGFEDLDRKSAITLAGRALNPQRFNEKVAVIEAYDRCRKEYIGL